MKLNQKQMEVYGTLSREWMIQADILVLLKQKYNRTYNPRRLRTIIKECRILYKEGKVPLLIIKSNRGYKLSDDYNEIEKFTHELMETGHSMMTEAQEILAAAKKKRVCPMDEYFKNRLEDMIESNVFSHLQLTEITRAIESGLTYAQIMYFANKKMHPYHMFLCRRGLLEGIDEEIVKAYADESVTVSEALILYRAARNGKGLKEIENFKKEMREREDKKNDKRKS